MKKNSNHILLFCFCGLIAFVSSCSQESDIVGTSAIDDALSTRSMCDVPSFYVCYASRLHLYNINGLYHDDIVPSEPEIVSAHCLELKPGDPCITEGWVQQQFDQIALELTKPDKFSPF